METHCLRRLIWGRPTHTRVCQRPTLPFDAKDSGCHIRGEWMNKQTNVEVINKNEPSEKIICNLGTLWPVNGVLRHKINHHSSLKNISLLCHSVHRSGIYMHLNWVFTFREFLTGCSQDVSQVGSHLKFQVGNDWFPSSLAWWLGKFSCFKVIGLWTPVCCWFLTENCLSSLVHGL